MDDSTNKIPTFAELAADPEIAPLLDFDAVPRQVSRPNGWTPERQREFIARLAWFGSPKLAADSMGKNVSGVTPLYKQKGSESFRTSWDGALALHASRQPPDAGTAFLGQVPGMGLRWAENRLSQSSPEREEGPDEDSDPSDDAKLDLIRHIAARLMRKVAAEREARLAGEIVAADFYLRQVTVIEVTLDLMSAGLGRNAQEVLRELRRGEHGLLEIASTGFSDLLDASRRRWWAEEGEPERPPHPDVRFLERHSSAEGDYATNVDQRATGALTTPARGYSQEEWAAMNTNEQRAARERQFEEDAEAQRAWEARAREAWRAEQGGGTVEDAREE